MIDTQLFIGQRFGKLICIATANPLFDKAGYPRKRVLCKCDCGREVTVNAYRLRVIKGCGLCHGKDRITHGAARRGTKFPRSYRIWRAMVRRCNDPKFPKYHNYGGRGIKVCERWLDYANFLNDMGECPSEKHSIHRKDNDKGYEPDNCKWADDVEQANNKGNSVKYTVRGVTGTLAELCRHFHCNYARANSRIWYGMKIELALFAPIGTPLTATELPQSTEDISATR